MTKKQQKDACYLIKYNLFAKVNHDPEYPNIDMFYISQVRKDKEDEERPFDSNEHLMSIINDMELKSIKDIYMVKLQNSNFICIRGNRDEILKEVADYKAKLK